MRHGAHIDKHAVGLHLGQLVSPHVLHYDALNDTITLDLGQGGVPNPFDLGVLEGAILEHWRRIQNAFIVNHDDSYRLGELSEEVGLFDGRIPVTEDHDVQLGKEVGVAGSAVRNTFAAQSMFTRDIQSARHSTRRKDDGLAPVALAILGIDYLLL